MDKKKVIRRIMDCLHKTATEQQVIEIAKILNVSTETESE